MGLIANFAATSPRQVSASITRGVPQPVLAWSWPNTSGDSNRNDALDDDGSGLGGLRQPLNQRNVGIRAFAAHLDFNAMIGMAKM